MAYTLHILLLSLIITVTQVATLFSSSNKTDPEKINLEVFLTLDNQQILSKVSSYLDNGGDINAADSDNNTLLHYSCLKKEKELASYLIERGANWEAKNKDNKTPLELVDKRNSYFIVYFNDAVRIQQQVSRRKKGGLLSSVREEITPTILPFLLKCSDLSQEAYSQIQFQNTENKLYTYLENQLSVIIEYRKENNIHYIYVAFRGTASSNDLGVNLTAGKTMISDDPFILSANEEYIYSGFLWRYQALSCFVRGSIIQILHDKKLITDECVSDNIEFYFTGHSLGGALASICTHDISKKLNLSPPKVHLVTFSAPAVFSKAFVEKFNRRTSPESYRLYANGDFIPSILPEAMGFYHAGKPIKVPVTFSEDPFAKEYTKEPTLSIWGKLWSMPTTVIQSMADAVTSASSAITAQHSMDRYKAILDPQYYQKLIKGIATKIRATQILKGPIRENKQ